MSTLTVIALLLGLMAAVGVCIWLRIRIARYRAIRDNDVRMFLGLVRLIVWEPNEGLVFLRYKRIADVIQGVGGMRFISPFFRGEELHARIPLTLGIGRITQKTDQARALQTSVSPPALPPSDERTR